MKIVTNSDMIRRYLSGHHEVVLATNEEITSDWYDTSQVGLIVVDIDSTQGVYTPRAIQKENPDLSIIGISEDLPFDAEWPEMRAIFIEQGGSYLLQAPINPREMLACIGAIDRRQRKIIRTVGLFRGRFIIKPSEMAVFFDDCPVALTSHEVKVLVSLAGSFGRCMSREDLLRMLYSYNFEEYESNIVEVFIGRIRKKLHSLHPDLDGCVKTVRGFGYMLVDPETD